MRGGKWGFIDTSGHLIVPLEWDHLSSGPGESYHLLFRETAPDKCRAVWVGPDLKEIWRAELPLVNSESKTSGKAGGLRM
jgi:hypothetical protein